MTDGVYLAGGVAVAVLLAACGPQVEQAAKVEPVGVEILTPASGDSVSLPITIRLSATGVTIAPATGLREDGVAHHHLLINVDVTPDGVPVPAAEGYVHLGTGVSEYLLNSLPPGEHRIIALLAWGDHVPITGALRDTVRVVVR